MTESRKTVGVLIFLFSGTKIWLAGRLDKTKPYYKMWATPGGKMEDNEKAEDAAVRELMEETGLEIHWSDLVYVGVSNHVYHEEEFVMHNFFMLLPQTSIPKNTEPHKHSNWEQFDVHELPLGVTPGTSAGLLQVLKCWYNPSWVA